MGWGISDVSGAMPIKFRALKLTVIECSAKMLYVIPSMLGIGRFCPNYFVWVKRCSVFIIGYDFYNLARVFSCSNNG